MNDANTKSVSVTLLPEEGRVPETITLTGEKSGYDFLKPVVEGAPAMFKAWAGNETLIVPIASVKYFRMNG